MEDGNLKTLFLFVDESGNFDFSPKGTEYFVLTCVATTNPIYQREKFLSLKYKLLGEDIEQEYFHATEDKQKVRDVIFSLIEEMKDFEVHSVVAQKNKTNWSLYTKIDAQEKEGERGIKFTKKQVEEKFYTQLSETLICWVFRRYRDFQNTTIDKIIIIFDILFNKTKQELVKKHLKGYFKQKFGIVPYIYFHQGKSDINCQMADYCGWAVFVKWERNEIRPYKIIQGKIKSEFNIFEQGEIIYYEYNKKTTPPPIQ